MVKRQIQQITDRMVYGKDTDWAMNIEPFDWVPGVGLYGIFHAYKATGDIRYLNFLTDWANRHVKDAYKQKTINSAAPLLTYLSLYEETKNEDYLKVCLELADDILSNAPRTVDGGLEHTVTEPVPGFSDQVWADTLFMVCIFLAKLGRMTGEKKYTDFAIQQLKIHHRLLSDGNGLYFHGYNGAKKDHMSAIRWARANGWILYSSMEILNVSGTFDDRDKIEQAIKAHANALAKVQRTDGGFSTILDDPTSYTEISATAAIAAGLFLAMDAGLIGTEYQPVWQKAISAVQNAVKENGEVDGVSSGTPVMPDADGYKNIPITPTLYGQGLAIIALKDIE